MRLISLFFLTLASFFGLPLMAAPSGHAGLDLLQFVPLLVAFVVMYFFFIRTQQKKDRQQKAMIESLREGQLVLTQSGLIGAIHSLVDEKEIMLTIAPNTHVRCLKSVVIQKIENKLPKKEKFLAKEEKAKASSNMRPMRNKNLNKMAARKK